MGFWQSYCHLVWGTKYREPLIAGDREEIIRQSIALKARDFETLIHAIGFMPEHIHLVISIPPKIAPSDFVHDAKGLASRNVNRESAEDLGHFSWQKEFGLISFGERSLPDIVRYVENQKKHHYEGQLWPLFERLEPVPPR